MTSENDRLNLSFAKVRVSLIPATLLCYFFHILFEFLSTGKPSSNERLVSSYEPSDHTL